MWNLVLVRLETVLESMQYRCTICNEHTIGSEIVLNTPDGSPRRVGHEESRFGPFEDSVSVSANGLLRMYHWL
jgi:hypothetical protein